MGTDQSSKGIRGTVLRSRIDYIRKRGGEPALEKVLSQLPPDDQKQLSGWLLNTAWYPLDLNLRFDAAIARVFSPDDPKRVFLEMGRASAEANLSGPQKHFLQKGNPHFLLGQAPTIYAIYYGVGRRTYEKTGPSSAILRTYEAENVTETDCLTIIGWHERALAMSGATGVKVEETLCRARGASHCEYHLSWRGVG